MSRLNFPKILVIGKYKFFFVNPLLDCVFNANTVYNVTFLIMSLSNSYIKFPGTRLTTGRWHERVVAAWWTTITWKTLNRIMDAQWVESEVVQLVEALQGSSVDSKWSPECTNTRQCTPISLSLRLRTNMMPLSSIVSYQRTS